MKGCEDVGPWARRSRAQMVKSDEVEAMLHLRALGWGLRRIAREFGCSKNTVKRYVAADGWMTYSRHGRKERAHRSLENRKERGFPQRPQPIVVLHRDPEEHRTDRADRRRHSWRRPGDTNPCPRLDMKGDSMR